MDSSLSVEATNRIRVALGLKPIPTEHNAPEDNLWAAEQELKDRRTKVHAKLSEAADRAAVRNLVDQHDQADVLETTGDWISRMKKPLEKAGSPEANRLHEESSGSNKSQSTRSNQNHGDEQRPQPKAHNLLGSEPPKSDEPRESVPSAFLVDDVLDPLSSSEIPSHKPPSTSQSRDFKPKEVKFKSRRPHKGKRRHIETEPAPQAPILNNEVLAAVLDAEKTDDIFVKPTRKAVKSSGLEGIPNEPSQPPAAGDTAAFLTAFKARKKPKHTESQHRDMDTHGNPADVEERHSESDMDGRKDEQGKAELDEKAQNINEDNGNPIGKGVGDALRLLESTGVIFNNLEENTEQNKKDAFKELSHAFHGTSEGKKRRQRRERRDKDQHDKIRRPLFPD